MLGERGSKNDERDICKHKHKIDYSTHVCLVSSLCFVVIVLLAFLCGGQLALCVFSGSDCVLLADYGVSVECTYGGTQGAAASTGARGRNNFLIL